MVIRSSPPHHVTKSLVGDSMICRWNDGFYLGVIKEFIPVRQRIDGSNVRIAYTIDNEVVNQHLSVVNYSSDPDAESPAWCLLIH